MKRLDAIASFVGTGSKIADVGSDHCYVPISLAAAKRISFAQAIENKKGPYERMVKEIAASGFYQIIKPSFSDGISKLSGEVDTLILAGLGGRLIISILEKDRKKLDNIETLIIDAHNERSKVIAYINSLGYEVVDNIFMIESGIAYDIMKWKKNKNARSYNEFECIFGPLNLLKKGDDWKRYWLSECCRIGEILNLKDLPPDKREYYIKVKADIEKALELNN